MTEETAKGVGGVKAVLYARVSSERQAEKDLSIPAQLKALRQYADKQGCRVVQQFVDEAQSARTADRPEFQKMMVLARQKVPPFTVILVWKLSRFARNREDSILYKSMLRKHGVQIVSINEPIDDSPAGRMLEGMIEVVDEFYSANLASDTIRGLNENASRGFLNGGCAPYGYRRVKVRVDGQEKARLEVDPVQAPVAKRIFKMCLDGMGVKEIAKKLNAEGCKTRAGQPWTNTVVHYMLTNETYTGALIFNRYRYFKPSGGKPQKLHRIENTHPALVTREEFARVGKLLHARSPRMTHPRTIGSEYLLSGLLFCGTCGAKMIGTTAKGGRFTYYGCQSYLKRGRAACNAGLMGQRFLEDRIIENLREEVLTDKNLSDLVRMVNEERGLARRSSRQRVTEVETQVKTLQGRLERLYLALESGHVGLADIGPRIKALREQVEAAEDRRAGIEAEEAAPVRLDSPDVRRQVGDMRRLLDDGTIMERKAWLRTWVKRVEVDKSIGGFIEYLMPMRALAQKQEGRPSGGPLNESVLSMVKNGSGPRIRT